jgi:two-component system cell cycle sensor histidine kinase/response regulator CckA
MVYDGGLKSGREGEPQAGDLPSHRKVILIVEDENTIRTLIAISLKAKGYSVLEAPNGGDALELCEEHRGPIHLLITDQNMPLMTGSELISRVAEVRPTMKLMCLSGLDRIPAQLPVNVHILQKPFTLKGLISNVQEVLSDGTPKCA